MEEECEEYNLNVISPNKYYDDYIDLLDEIHDKASQSNLGTGNISVISVIGNSNSGIKQIILYKSWIDDIH